MFLLALAMWLAEPACTRAKAGGPSVAAAPAARTVITQEQIAASGVKTAWDALRRFVPYVHFRDNRGRPARMTRRGTASIYLDDQVRLIVDDVRVYDLQLLDQMPASDILTIEVLSGLDATTRYGGTSTSGLILIRTRTGSE